MSDFLLVLDQPNIEKSATLRPKEARRHEEVDVHRRANRIRLEALRRLRSHQCQLWHSKVPFSVGDSSPIWLTRFYPYTLEWQEQSS
ncbi:hypothetical protein [Xanthomonas phaseoli]|nr:hypothetical protein [Xanthomonas phaseoli]MBO9782211.1 hypothetical protein [Xanthomonas phaseoli pv. dieffenbachiae]